MQPLLSAGLRRRLRHRTRTNGERETNDTTGGKPERKRGKKQEKPGKKRKRGGKPERRRKRKCVCSPDAGWFLSASSRSKLFVPHTLFIIPPCRPPPSHASHSSTTPAIAGEQHPPPSLPPALRPAELALPSPPRPPRLLLHLPPSPPPSLLLHVRRPRRRVSLEGRPHPRVQRVPRRRVQRPEDHVHGVRGLRPLPQLLPAGDGRDKDELQQREGHGDEGDER